MRPVTLSKSLRATLAMPLALGLAATPLLTPSSASACGGLFCDTQPVAQNAERILFEINGDGTVTTSVEIRYAGETGGFAWVVPVPDTPSLDVISQSTLALLDTATVPQIIPPPVTCTGADPFQNEDFASGAGDDDDADGAPVDVEDLPVVGPFDPEVVSSEDPAALIDWLNENGYLITPEMEPYVGEYVAAGMKFLGMKLAPGAGVSDITPIQMTYPSETPTIPIVLTAVGAEPEMGVLVFIAANERWESDNYVNLEMDVEDVQFDPRTGENNYYPLVSWRLDDVGGKGLLTEYADSASDAWTLIDGVSLAVSDATESRAYLQQLLTRRSYLTRAYTRLSAPDMDADPSFAPSGSGDVSRVLDLSDRPAVEICSTAPNENADVPCGDMYCGENALCATTDSGIDGCVCPEGSTARTITAPSGPGRFLTQTVVCQDATFDLLASAVDAGDAANACDGFSCGDNGSCMDVGGFPSCACEEGYAATTSGGQLTCDRVQRTFEPEQLLWASAGCSSGCDASAAAGSGALIALLLVPLAILRRRLPR